MDLNNLNNNYSTILQKFANDLYEKDDDKVITKQEISEYLFTVQNDADFISLNISTSQAEAELDRLLNNNDKTAQNNISKTSTTPTVGNAESSADSAKSTESTDFVDNAIEEYNKAQARISELEELIKSYDERKITLNSSIAELQPELEQAQKLCEGLSKTLKQQQENYKNLEKKAENKNKEYEKLAQDVEKMQQKLVEDTKNRQEDALKKAKNDYNPEKDGSWEEFAQKYLDDVASSPLQRQLNSLISNLKDLSSALSSLSSKMKSQANDIKNAQGTLETQTKTTTALSEEYNAQVGEISELDSLSETSKVELEKNKQVTANSVLGMIPEAELNLVKEHNLDLKEQLPDGSPRYIIAKGAEDGIFHIYDNIDVLSVKNAVENQAASFCCPSMSLVRKYCPDGGYDLISMGNGYISVYDDESVNLFGGNGGTASGKIYHFDSCGNIKCNEAKYMTASPLSLDINGDGVKTSSNIIDYDIDGDGVKDKINDSADAVLVFDKDGDGISGTDGSECFGNNTDIDGDGKADGYKDGFEALKAMAKKEGLIGENDSVLDENDLKTLEDKYGLKIKTGGYNSNAQSLADVGITEINLADTNETTMLDNFDGNGNQLMTQKGATFKVNGETREYADIWHKKLDEDDIKAQEANNTSKTYTMSDFKADEEALNFKFNNNIFSDITTSQQKGRNVLNKANSTKLDNLVDIDSGFESKKTDEIEAEKEENEKKKKLNPFG